MSLSSLKLKVYLLGFLGLLQAPYRVTGFIWHGNAHYVAYLVSGYQWYCLNDAVVSEVDVGDLPSQACMIFLEKVLRLTRKATGAGPRQADSPPDSIWMQLPAGRKEQRSGRTQQRSGQEQQRSGREHSRDPAGDPAGNSRDPGSGGERQSSGREEQRSGRQDCREARQRQEKCFSASAWSGNMDGARGDTANEADNPFKRFQHASRLHMRQEKESLRFWPQRPLLIVEQPCLLCDGVGFRVREELLVHIDAAHGGLQRYRNAYLHLESLWPHVVVGSEALRLRLVPDVAFYPALKPLETLSKTGATLCRQLCRVLAEVRDGLGSIGAVKPEALALQVRPLSNDLWLGRPDPLLWKANMTHEMCLALARTVATKVVLRAGGTSQTETSDKSNNSWDYVFQQSGLVGSAVVFHNGDAEYALESCHLASLTML